MKALLVSHSNGGGGAGRATQRLFDALDARGVDVRMYADFKHGDDPRICTVRGPLATQRRSMRIAIEEVPGVLADLPDRHLFSPALVSAVSARRIDAEMADVANVHWTGYGTLSIAQLGRVKTPVVMTLHDMWAATGGLGYESEGPDARWRRGYTKANRSGLSRFDVERWVANRKRDRWRIPRHLVTPSRWLAEVVRESDLLHDWPVTTIPNPVDTELFAPRPQSAARRRLGIDPNARVVLVATGNTLDDPRKGVDLVLESMHHLIDVEHLHLVIAGPSEPTQQWRSPVATTFLGRLNDDQMVAAYSSADVVCVPSRQDNLPQTATEAQSCGLSVVGFRIGGLPDVVGNSELGYLATPFDTRDLADGTRRLLEAEGNSERRRADIHAVARARWNPGIIAEQYVDLFEGVRTQGPALH